MKTLDERLQELKTEGLKNREVAQKLHEEEFRTPGGLQISEHWVGSRLNYLKTRNEPKRPTLQFRPHREKAMVTLEEPAPKPAGKIIAVVCEMDDVERLIDKVFSR